MKRTKRTGYRNKDAKFFDKVGKWKKKIRALNILESKPKLGKSKGM